MCSVPTERVAPLLEVVQEGLAHFGGSPLGLVVRHGCGLRACEEGSEEAWVGGEARRVCLRRQEASEGGVSCWVTQIASSQSCVEHHQTAGARRGAALQMNGSLNASSRIAQKRARLRPSACPVNINTKQSLCASTHIRHSPTCNGCPTVLSPTGTERSTHTPVEEETQSCHGWRQSAAPTNTAMRPLP